MAKRVKGKAKAIEKASIPSIGFTISPPADATSMLPTKGPVQENDTTIRVRAIKNMPNNPPFSDLASILVTKLLGSVSSNIPRKDRPKAKKTVKNSRLGIQ